MSIGNVLETELLDLLLNNQAILLIGDAGGLLPSAADGNLYVALHTGDPGEAGDQTTTEAAYTSYAREAAIRDDTFWTVAAGTANPAANIDFTPATGGSETETFASVGVAVSGASKIIMSGAIAPTIVVADGTTPRLTTATALTLD